MIVTGSCNDIVGNFRNKGDIIESKTMALTECKKLCRDTEECSGWSWHKSNELCKLFSVINKINVQSSKYQSGNCSGKAMNL